VCSAAFKNLSDPRGALDEIHRVLRPGARASIHDLRRDAIAADIESETQGLQLSWLNTIITRWTFQSFLLKSARALGSLRNAVASAAPRS
jgi:ubiquinone/menaquinone biosynthesis C-methylase UbiE